MSHLGMSLGVPQCVCRDQRTKEKVRVVLVFCHMDPWGPIQLGQLGLGGKYLYPLCQLQLTSLLVEGFLYLSS